MNNVNYEMYDTINDNVQISKLKDILLRLHDICGDNLEIVSNSSWKAKAKNKYNEYIESINNDLSKLDLNVEKLSNTTIRIDEIKKINKQIEELKQKIEESSAIGMDIGMFKEQLNALMEEKHRRETEMFGWWN